MLYEMYTSHNEGYVDDIYNSRIHIHTNLYL